MTEIAERFAANLVRARKAADLSQEELAFRAGIHRTEVGFLERGQRTPRIDTLIKLAAAVDHMPAELLEGMDWKLPELEPGRFLGASGT